VNIAKDNEIRRATVLVDLRRVITSLELVSHTSAQALDPQPRETTDSKGGARPSGGVDHAGDREQDYRQKSADHFMRRVGKAKTVGDLEAILGEARDALEAWRRPPKPLEPLPDDPRFKSYVAASDKSASELARLHGISARTVHRWRAQYLPADVSYRA
jgi:hypothetical protein